MGAHLANAALAGECEVFYWRERNQEVDFVARAGRQLVDIEVKSGHKRAMPAGMAAFTQAFKGKRSLLVGDNGVPMGDFLSRPVQDWIKA